MGIAHVRALTLALLVATPLLAHEIGTTQVTARFNRDHTYDVDVVTKSPLVRGANLSEAAEIRFGGVRVKPEVIRLPDGTIRFHGDIPRNAGPFTWRWPLTFSYYALTIGPRQQWLDGDTTSSPFPLSADLLPPSRMDVVKQYLKLGFTHIVPGGLDHILFVLGIFLLSTKLRPVLTQVTAFTIAHSITLGLTIYGLVSVSPRIVEPMIALSIAYVAIENITTSQLKPWRVAIVFAFGLLHGMGFAGVLKELGLPRSEFLTALVTFNVGVELGQLAVIATAFVLIAAWARTKPWYRPRFVVPASAAIAATGIFWTVQRLL
ncbi:MAG TPA: HupE/UreJ family protein [Thermoanaerobaculia bacterium]|nr:HupE/UreJ family protein [Thermoanaerobaculia bacterium]